MTDPKLPVSQALIVAGLLCMIGLASSFIYAGNGLLKATSLKVRVGASPTTDKVNATLVPTELKPILHQPVILTFTVKNESESAIVLDLGRDSKESFIFSVRFPDGSRADGRTYPFPPQGGISLPGRTTIGPGGQFIKSLIFNEWSDLPTPGEYLIEGKLSNAINLGDAGIWLKFQTSFVVGSQDDERLRRVCESILGRVEKAGRLDKGTDAAIELSHVDDPIAVQYIAKAIESKYTIDSTIINTLRRRAGRTSVDALIAYVRTGTNTESVAYAKSALKFIDATTDDPAVKNRIADSFSVGYCEMFPDGQLACSCKELTSRVEYCVVARISPPDRVVVNDRLRNLSREQIFVPIAGPMEQNYLIEITDVEGDRRVSRRRISLPKPGEPITDWPIYSERNEGEKYLAPEESVSSEFVLTEPDVLKPGTSYRVKFGRRLDEKDTVSALSSNSLILEIRLPAPMRDDSDILSKEYRTAEAALTKAVSDKDLATIKLGLRSRFLTIRQKTAEAMSSIKIEGFLPDLLAALRQNRSIIGGGTEIQVEQRNLDRAIVSAIARITTLEFDVSDDQFEEEIESVIRTTAKWLKKKQIDNRE